MMASDVDELEINPFYISLHSKYADLCERAQQNCYLLCVPRAGSFSHKDISSDFVATHILRPSPYFKGQFMTTHTSNGKTLILSEDGQFFTTLQGFEEEMKIKILAEELAYNKEYRQYKILIIDGPFDSKFKLKSPQLEEQQVKQLHPHKLTGRECTEFLKSFPEFKGVLENLDANIEYFCRHYMVLPEYLDDAVTRLGAMRAEVQKEMMKKLKSSHNEDMKLREVIIGATESYIMSAVHYKVFVEVRERFTHADRILLSKCHILNKVRPEDIGVRKQFCCPLPAAVVELANLGSLLTPKEKLTCLKSTVDNITEGITALLNKRRQTPSLEDILFGADKEACITSDDLIPILVMVIAQAKCCHLHSDLFYTENFMWQSLDRDRDDFGYCLVSFKAAVQYMMETDFSHLKQAASSDKEISLEELMAVTSLQSKICAPARPPSSSEMQTRRERQLHKISTILEQTAQEMGQQMSEQTRLSRLHSIFPDRVLKSSLPDVLPEQDKLGSQESQLGDFLSALQNDDFDQPFGKQS